MAGTNLPREPVGKDGIYPVDIANALTGLRLDRIVSAKWSITPSVGIVAKDIQRLGLDIRSFREPLTTVIKTVMIPSIRKNFDSGGRPPWEPLAEDTIKARGYSAWPILQVTGRLKKRATQFNIWSIGAGSATVRALPDDVYYGAYHQGGSQTTAGTGEENIKELLDTVPGSKAAEKLIGKFLPAAIKELGSKASPTRVHNRAIGMLMDAGGGSLPARPFIMWQPEDVPKIEDIFSAWMEMRAIKSGRFRIE